MDELIATLSSGELIDFWQATLSVTGIFLILDAIIMSRLSGPHRAERSHYALCLFSILIYLAIVPLGAQTFKEYWIQIITGFYLFDLCIIARDWHQLKPSYRIFYSVHHGASLGFFFLWHFTFEPFTQAMVIAAVAWLSSDIWRWSEQLWRLSGHHLASHYRHMVDRLERVHRLIAYVVFFWMVDFHFQHRSEIILLLSGITMDVIDSYFVKKARSKAQKTRPPSYQPLIEKKAAKKAA